MHLSADFPFSPFSSPLNSTFFNPIHYTAFSLLHNTMTDDDAWLKAAMADDSVVVDLLVRLNQPPPLKLQWTVRQRRSKQKNLTARASPTTPLSWSGAATSHSLDCYEESSTPPLSNPSTISRSKGIGLTSEIANTKRSNKKKKTLSELKEEETLLLKERRQLKRELATLHTAVEKHRAANQSLKKMKMDLQSQSEAKIVKIQDSNKENNTFCLPDLNLPLEEDNSS